jgi:hypothetical protein
LIRAGYFSGSNSGATKQIFLDLQRQFKSASMLNREGFKEEFERLLVQVIPKRLAQIIHLDDAASQEMARIVKTRCNKSTELISAAELHHSPHEHIKRNGASLVVAGAVASGRGLLAVSQALRAAQESGAICYLIGTTRTTDAQALKELRMNLTYGERAENYGFFSVENIYLPVFGDSRTSWDDERDLCCILANHEDDAKRAYFSTRLTTLTGMASKRNRGLSDDLFLGPSVGGRLRLRPGFAFFDSDYEGRAVSQADVFFTVLSVLHHVRTRKDGKPQLKNLDNVRSVLSPRTFDRFNDGIIQASLLRACHPIELDYSHFKRESGEMTEILRFILNNSENPAGEAATEFVLALALGHVRLAEQDGKDLHKTFRTAGGPVLQALWDSSKLG